LTAKYGKSTLLLDGGKIEGEEPWSHRVLAINEARDAQSLPPVP
jgi:hypothetical protein